MVDIYSTDDDIRKYFGIDERGEIVSAQTTISRIFPGKKWEVNLKKMTYVSTIKIRGNELPDLIKPDMLTLTVYTPGSVFTDGTTNQKIIPLSERDIVFHVNEEIFKFDINLSESATRPLTITKIIVELPKQVTLTTGGKEAFPAHVLELGELCAEDIVNVTPTNGFDSATMGWYEYAKRILFSKEILIASSGTTYNKLTIPATREIVLYLKELKRVKQIKLLEVLQSASTPTIVNNENVLVTITYGDGSTTVHNPNGKPIEINDEISAIAIQNMSEEEDFDLCQVIAETYNHVVATIEATEAKPLNVIADDEIVAEHVYSALLFDGNEYTPLTRAQIESLFQKNTEGLTPFSLPGETELYITLKKPFNISRAKALTLAGNGVPFFVTMPSLTFSYTDCNGFFPQQGEAERSWLGNPAEINQEVSLLILRNDGELPINIYHIIAELEHRVTNKPVIYGLDYGEEIELEEEEEYHPGDGTYGIFEWLGRNGHDGYIINDGEGDITVEISNRPIATAVYGGANIVRKDEIFDLEKYDIGDIRIIAVAATTIRVCIL